MDDPGVVKQQRGQRLGHDKAHTRRAVCIKYPCLAPFDALAPHQHHHHKIDAVAVCALRRGAADTPSRVDAELVRLDEPLRGRLDLRKQAAQRQQQSCP